MLLLCLSTIVVLNIFVLQDWSEGSELLGNPIRVLVTNMSDICRSIHIGGSRTCQNVTYPMFQSKDCSMYLNTMEQGI
jgi:hypothetical protein